MDIEKILADVTSIEISVINLNLDLDTRGLKNYIYDKFTKFLLKKKAKELAKDKNFNASNFEKSITPYENLTNQLNAKFSKRKLLTCK